MILGESFDATFQFYSRSSDKNVGFDHANEPHSLGLSLGVSGLRLIGHYKRF